MRGGADDDPWLEGQRQRRNVIIACPRRVRHGARSAKRALYLRLACVAFFAARLRTKQLELASQRVVLPLAPPRQVCVQSAASASEKQQRPVACDAHTAAATQTLSAPAYAALCGLNLQALQQALSRPACALQRGAVLVRQPRERRTSSESHKGSAEA